MRKQYGLILGFVSFFQSIFKIVSKTNRTNATNCYFFNKFKKNNNNKIVWWCVCVCFSKVNWYLFFLFLSNFNPYLGGFESNLFPLFVMEFYFCCAGIFYIYDFHTYTVCNFGLYFSNRNVGIVILFFFVLWGGGVGLNSFNFFFCKTSHMLFFV